MKKHFIIHLIFLGIISFRAEAQKYSVIYLSGKLLVDDGAMLEKGSIVSVDNRVTFGSPDAMAALVNESKERYVIRCQSGEKRANTAYPLDQVLIPVRGRASTRASGLNNAMDIQKYFGTSPVVFLSHREEVPVSALAYPQNQSSFFFLQYVYRDEIVNKKMPYEDSRLVWDKSEIFKVDGNAIDFQETKDHTLFYFRSESEQEKLTNLTFSFLPENEWRALIELSPDGSYPQVDELEALIFALYGKCDRGALVAKLDRYRSK